MVTNFDFCGNNFTADYDEDFINGFLDKIGMEHKTSKRFTKLAIIYYSANSSQMKPIYIKIAKEENLNYVTVNSRIRRGLEEGIYNGKLKEIDDIIAGVEYDYDYAFTVKDFVALACCYLQNCGRLKTTINQ